MGDDQETARRVEQRAVRDLVLKLQGEGKSKDEIKKICKERKASRKRRSREAGQSGFDDRSSKMPRLESVNGVAPPGPTGTKSENARYAFELRQARREARKAEGREKREGPCFAFQKGECTRGDSCLFSHTDQTSNGYGSSGHGGNRGSDGFGKGVCFAFQKGNCFKGENCRFLHERSTAPYASGGWDESSRGDWKESGNNNSNTNSSNGGIGVCFAFQKGNCFKGDKCRFSHEGEGKSQIDRWNSQKAEQAPAPHDAKTGAGRGESGNQEGKRGVCFAFQKGNCFKGNKCRFSHDAGGESVGNNAQQLEENTPERTNDWPATGFGGDGRGVCFAFQKGNCSKGYNCRFSHEASAQGSGDGGSQGGGMGRGACFAFQKGNCDRGDDCRFSHQAENNYGGAAAGGARGVCYAFQSGNCFRGNDCRFSHDTSSGGGQFNDTRGACHAFQRGECYRGDQCKFSHGQAYAEEELEKQQFRDEKARKHDLVIIPILWKKREDEAQTVRDAAQELKNKLMKHRINSWIDQRTSLTPAEKYGYWEDMGVRYRMELGPQEVASHTTCLSVSPPGLAEGEQPQQKLRGAARQVAERWKDLSTDVGALHDILRILREQGMSKIDIDDDDDEGCTACAMIREEEKLKPPVSLAAKVDRKAIFAPGAGKRTAFEDDSGSDSDSDSDSADANKSSKPIDKSGDSLQGNWI